MAQIVNARVELTPDDLCILTLTSDLFPAVTWGGVVSAAGLRVRSFCRPVVPVGVVAHATAFKLHKTPKYKNRKMNRFKM